MENNKDESFPESTEELRLIEARREVLRKMGIYAVGTTVLVGALTAQKAVAATGPGIPGGDGGGGGSTVIP